MLLQPVDLQERFYLSCVCAWDKLGITVALEVSALVIELARKLHQCFKRFGVVEEPDLVFAHF